MQTSVRDPGLRVITAQSFILSFQAESVWSTRLGRNAAQQLASARVAVGRHLVCAPQRFGARVHVCPRSGSGRGAAGGSWPRASPQPRSRPPRLRRPFLQQRFTVPATVSSPPPPLPARLQASDLPPPPPHARRDIRSRRVALPETRQPSAPLAEGAA